MLMSLQSSQVQKKLSLTENWPIQKGLKDSQTQLEKNQQKYLTVKTGSIITAKTIELYNRKITDTSIH